MPPRSGHPNFLTSALRRLSSSGGQLAGSARNGHGGICPRKVLNVDCQRERCQIPELDQSKLRRVAFCVDVEIASGPRYHDEEGGVKENPEKSSKKKLAEKGEAEALKHPQEVEKQKETDGVIQVSGEHLPKEPEKESSDPIANGDAPAAAGEPAALGEGGTTKKKEKKKRSEEERKARKEKKRKLAEENGTIPVELTRSDSDSDSGTGCSTQRSLRSTASPTTDPARIYRRCCQLRETPILKKITEQLMDPTNLERPGFVTKLDLTGLFLQLPDLITLGDYLAVVPIKELVMENCQLTDEGVRVILAGLLAAASPDQYKRRSKSSRREVEQLRRGAVHRVVLKNNPNIGRDGWRYISLFINMSRSLKVLDVSMIPFPQTVANGNGNGAANAKTGSDSMAILSKALSTRLAGPDLELLNMAATGLAASQIALLCDGIIKSQCAKRMGLAENNINAEGIQHICRYLKAGYSEGLDLGANDMSDHLETIAEALDENHPLFALSLANCALTPEALWKLFPALAKLKNFRFIDLSNNHDIFAIKPSAVYLLRKYVLPFLVEDDILTIYRYLPKMPMLKRIHLTDCALSSEQAIALAEIFPDAEGLAHVSLLENPELVALADATDEANQEEACALYASLMAAVRVSKSLVAIDIDMPSANSSEVVKALAKQVVAYSLRNMERGPLTEIAGAVNGLDAEGLLDKEPEMPEVLAHLVGRDNNDPASPAGDDDEAAPDEDYVIGGTGVVKALGICLKNRNTNSRRPSIDRATSDWDEQKKDAGKAKDMSKNLLGSARKIRARLQPALLKEARQAKGSPNYHKLLFLDQTLERMIGQFEAEYPETRAEPVEQVGPDANALNHTLSGLERRAEEDRFEDAKAELDAEYALGVSEDEYGFISRPMLSRHNSDVSLASKAQTQEEGRMHRFGQKFRRDIVNADPSVISSSAIEDSSAPMTPADSTHGHSAKWAPHLEVLRAMLEEMGGEEMKRKIEEGGQDVLLKELGMEAGELRRRIIEEDPEAWRRFREAQEAAVRNSRREGEGPLAGEE